MRQKGQVLVSILIIIAVAVLAIGTAVVASSLSKTIGVATTSDKLLYAAESGADEALIKLLRNPTTYSSESISINGTLVQITISRPSATNIVILSSASQDNLIRKVEVSSEFVNNILTITSWREVP